MIKNKIKEIWKFEDTLPSSLYHLTSKNSSLFLLPSTILHRSTLPSYVFHLPSLVNLAWINRNKDKESINCHYD